MTSPMLPLLAQLPLGPADDWLALLRATIASPVFQRFLLVWACAVVVAIVVALVYQGPPSSITGRRVGFVRRVVQWQLFALLAAGVLTFQLGEIRATEKRQFKLYEDTLYLPSPRTVRLVALGYDEALASGLFIRSIQAYGGGWQFTGQGGRPKLFEHYFDLITDLDPTFERAYTFGNMMVGEEMRNPPAGMALMVKGLHQFPENWRIPYEGGFFAQDRLKDYDRAVKYFQVAVRRPDVPAWVDRQLSYFAIRGGQFRPGIERFLQLYLTSIQNRSDIELNIARGRLVRTQIDWGRYLIKQAIEEYQAAHDGRMPDTLDVLLDTEALASYDYVDLSHLFPRREVMAQPGDPLYTPVAPLVGELALPGVPLADQTDRFAERIFLRLERQIPPTPDHLGWIYDPMSVDRDNREEFTIRPASDMEQDMFLFRLAAHLAREIRGGAVAPEDTAQLRDWIGHPIPADPFGTFFLFNPVTNSLTYMRDFMVER